MKRQRSEDEGEGEGANQVKKPKETTPEPTITSTGPSESQKRALLLLLEGRSLFITGEAGTGKSYLIERVKEQLTKMRVSFCVTATTGSAAYNIGGITLHSFAGLGLGEGDVAKLVTRMLNRQADAMERWRSTRCLIIDEVSMLLPEYFEKLNYAAKRVRGNQLPFGGMQLLLVGDFFQLPPVDKDRPVGKIAEMQQPQKNRYIFQTAAWKALNPVLVKLDHNFRQQEDDHFRTLLHSVRLGAVGKEEEEALCARSKEKKVPDEVTKLFSDRATTQYVNRLEMAKIKSPSHYYEAEIYQCEALKKRLAAFPNNNNANNAKNYPVDKEIELKVGASVLLCCNLCQPMGLFNGSRGDIIDFVYEDGSSEAEVDASDEEARRGAILYPLVRFYNGMEIIVTPYTWSQYEKDSLITSFTQVPIILRYAITIHKSQGLTLDSALVDCNFFESGQAYVAISRVRRLENLYLTNFKPANTKKIVSDPLVLKFYKESGLL